jgi:hypothetical protein
MYLLVMEYVWTKNAFWDVNNKKWRKWYSFVSPFLFNTLMAYLSSQNTSIVKIKYFMFDWAIYRLFVLNTSWKRDSQQMMIFVNFCSTWSMVELKTRFETWIIRNDVNAVSLFPPSLFNNTNGLTVLTMVTKCANQVFYVRLVDLQIISAT